MGHTEREEGHKAGQSEELGRGWVEEVQCLHGCRPGETRPLVALLESYGRLQTLDVGP